MPRGAAARVLVDTGNRPGTYRLGTLGPAESAEVSTARRRHWSSNSSISNLNAGYNGAGQSRRSATGPSSTRIPAELERLDLVDVLVGHDLLGSYRLTIDLSAARLAA